MSKKPLDPFPGPFSSPNIDLVLRVLNNKDGKDKVSAIWIFWLKIYMCAVVTNRGIDVSTSVSISVSQLVLTAELEAYSIYSQTRDSRGTTGAAKGRFRLIWSGQEAISVGKGAVNVSKSN
jgi:hypothetical protein